MAEIRSVQKPLSLVTPSNRVGQGFTVWFTGLSGSGKNTVAGLVGQALRDLGYKVEVLDGDVIRTHNQQRAWLQ